ncbi:MAG: chromosome segregation protein, partial [Solirubrobacteraceae bacterium]|nr:chromosome segregation protein [Solirubrobacteraceae bacterium]
GALASDRAAALERELAELEERRAAAEGEAARLSAGAEATAARRGEADEAVEAARRARREVESAAEKARREAARVGAELAMVNQFRRAPAGAPGGAAALADGLSAEPGYELALAAALGPLLRAAVAADVPGAGALLDRAGRDGGAALVVPGSGPAAPGELPASASDGSPPAAASDGSPPAPGAEALLSRVRLGGGDAARRLAAALLSRVWVVDSLDGLGDFDGIAVTRGGRVWSPATRELRQVPAGGEDRVLAERNRRDALLGDVECSAQAERAALAQVEFASEALAAADRARDEAEREARAARRARDEAAEAERHARWLIDQRRRAPDEGPDAERRAQLESAVSTERRLAERAARERDERTRRIELEASRLTHDEALLPRAERLVAALEAAAAAVAARVEVLGAEMEADRAAGERLAGELRACAASEARVHARLKEHGEVVTREEVRAQQARDRAADAGAELERLATKLGLEAEPAEEALGDAERASLADRIERLRRRREQLGPVNPLAQQEYQEAVAHVEELEAQREDLEAALRELRGLIRDTDKRIQQAFEETFAAAAANFEEVAGQLFPGGRGRLRLVREDSGPRPVLGGGEDGEDPSDEERLEDAAESESGPDEDLGVEIEITPAGKSTKRLTLLSGGEKSLTALAFLFAVFLARPCPFYILDEVEAALDDLNIDRFLKVLGSFSDRAQFIVVTHQKRTMEAADCLYGVSMAGDGVSRVVSRRLPPRAAERAA